MCAADDWKQPFALICRNLIGHCRLSAKWQILHGTKLQLILVLKQILVLKTPA